MVQEQLPVIPRRELLHELLLTLSDHVYFQEPDNINMQYPCIKYEWDSAETSFADNRPYRFKKRYQVMVIDEDPDSDIPEKVAQLPACRFDRRYAAESLHHFVFHLFF